MLRRIGLKLSSRMQRQVRWGMLSLLLVMLLSPFAWSLEESTGQANHWPHEFTAGPFLVHANFALDDLQPLLVELTQLPAELNESLGVELPQQVIHVYLLDRRATYRSYLGQYFPEVPDRRAMFISQRNIGMVFAYRNPELANDLRHECTHGVLHATLPMVPLWLDEGIAEYFEVPAERREHDSPHLTSSKWRARIGMVPDLEALEQIGNLGEMGAGEYRDAWAWVHYMLHGSPRAAAVLQSYLGDIARQNPPGLLSRRLELVIPKVHNEMEAHLKQW